MKRYFKLRLARPPSIMGRVRSVSQQVVSTNARQHTSDNHASLMVWSLTNWFLSFYSTAGSSNFGTAFAQSLVANITLNKGLAQCALTQFTCYSGAMFHLSPGLCSPLRVKPRTTMNRSSSMKVRAYITQSRAPSWKRQTGHPSRNHPRPEARETPIFLHSTHPRPHRQQELEAVTLELCANFVCSIRNIREGIQLQHDSINLQGVWRVSVSSAVAGHSAGANC